MPLVLGRDEMGSSLSISSFLSDQKACVLATGEEGRFWAITSFHGPQTAKI
ncbi:hypothetical protein COLO4_29534 [Corchorus olitorius]|uniref:Uncharacterized protein n=1 Tax=Corchorus olitorius TaxID=93759 RepID=A0A1R3HE60_9ROSI|nr:hypothetical protein COLO4_29534 [Corchorus olitorius]